MVCLILASKVTHVCLSQHLNLQQRFSVLKFTPKFKFAPKVFIIFFFAKSVANNQSCNIDVLMYPFLSVLEIETNAGNNQEVARAAHTANDLVRESRVAK